MAAPLPVVCSLEVSALGRRQADLRAGILSEAAAVERLPNGCRWRFNHAPDLLARLGPFLDAERHCCRFLTMSLAAEPDQGPVTLEVTGPAGTSDFLETWIPQST